MAKPSPELIQVIRKTARNWRRALTTNGPYGRLHCGFLAQEVTQLTKEEIHKCALLGQGDWSEQLNDYCPTNGLPFDEVISKLIGLGWIQLTSSTWKTFQSGNIARPSI